MGRTVITITQHLNETEGMLSPFRRTPIRAGGDHGHQQRRSGPSQIARQSMNRKRMPKASFGNPPVDDGEVGRVKNAIACTRHRGRQHQHGVVLRGSQH